MLRILGHPDRALLSKPSLAGGCKLCFPGAKAVIFVTGICDDGCYYCPVSRSKLGRNVFFVNEENVVHIEDAVLEVARTGAEGASITGGDPLAAADTVEYLITRLKEAFGSRFHIHLYTSGRYATPETLAMLDAAGLDEIRFHPARREFVERARLARALTGMSVGFEIPIGPGLEEWAKEIIRKADEYGLDFVNLNELEFVEPNAQSLLARGLRESRRRPFTVEGALEAAVRVLEWAAANASVPVHFCPAPFKDAIQTRNRLRRTAEVDTRWNEHPTPAGTVRWLEERGREVWLVEAHPTRSRKPVVGAEPVDRG